MQLITLKKKSIFNYGSFFRDLLSGKDLKEKESEKRVEQ